MRKSPKIKLKQLIFLNKKQDFEIFKKIGPRLENDVQSGRLLDQDLDGRHEGSGLSEAAA